MKRFFLILAVAACAASARAFPEVPRESYKALGATRGKLITTGLVFVNGKFVKPPYVVARWGTGIRINNIPVTGQIVEWSEFLKTQAGYRPGVSVPAPAAAPALAPAAVEPPPPPPPAEEEEEADEDDEDITSLDDLFDDNPKPKKKAAKPKKKKRPAAPRPRPAPSSAAAQQPAVVSPGTFEGEFVKNDAVKALRAKVNAARTEIDRQLRLGGFICFGDRYSRIVGDSRTAVKVLETLPELQMRSDSPAAFAASVRAAKLDYLNELVCEELYRNRIDYRPLQEHREKLRREHEWEKMMAPPKPLF